MTGPFTLPDEDGTPFVFIVPMDNDGTWDVAIHTNIDNDDVVLGLLTRATVRVTIQGFDDDEVTVDEIIAALRGTSE